MSRTQTLRRQETVALPTELSGTVPREVRLSGGGIALAVIASAMAIGALVSAILLSVVFSRFEAQFQRSERDGATAQAHVVQVATRRGEHPRRIVTYGYEVDGRSYTGRTTLRQRDRRAIAQGEPIAIGYLRSHPESSWMAGYEPDVMPLWVIPLMSGGLLLGAAAITWAVRRQWVLLSEGRVARARIVAHKKIRKDKHTAYRVNYEFQTLSGATHTGRYDVRKGPPQVGTTMTIVYHRDNPKWSAAYPLQLVRPTLGARRY
jgi:hypothetical protein